MSNVCVCIVDIDTVMGDRIPYTTVVALRRRKPHVMNLPVWNKYTTILPCLANEFHWKKNEKKQQTKTLNMEKNQTKYCKGWGKREINYVYISFSYF